MFQHARILKFNFRKRGKVIATILQTYEAPEQSGSILADLHLTFEPGQLVNQLGKDLFGKN